MIFLQVAADYIRTGRPFKVLADLLHRRTKLISFIDERENRPPRYVAVMRAYRDGTPIKDIEARFGCSKNTVHRYARMAGLYRPNESSVKDGILAMYQLGKPIATIAAHFGVSQALVSKYATEAGINRKPDRRRRVRP